jgi:hypothetical protein
VGAGDGWTREPVVAGRRSHHRGCVDATSSVLSLQPLLPRPVAPVAWRALPHPPIAVTGRTLYATFPVVPSATVGKRRGRATMGGRPIGEEEEEGSG